MVNIHSGAFKEQLVFSARRCLHNSSSAHAMETVHLSFFLLLCFGVQQSTSDILERQKRNWIIDSFSIKEGYSGEFPYSLGRVQLEKNLNFFKIFGQGVEKEPKGILQIHENTGEITVLGPVDYEKFHTLKVTFQALNEKNMVIETQLGIEIQVIDFNDNPPKFDAEQYEVTVEESTIQGTDLIILQAYDHDTERNNGIFDLNIVSVNPEPQELEFYLTQDEGSPFGKISFKGCLDHETAEKYTIIVEAKDRGEELQLSSSCTVTINIEDGNNHLPIITGQTGPGRVKERVENVLVSRLQVTDTDSKGTAGWRAKYQIHGDEHQHFRISTDPDTNEGLLYVQKHLDYENDPVKNITISVENVIPYHSCTVVSRSSSGLWKVVTGSGTPASVVTEAETVGGSIIHVTVIVEDVNDSPIFDKSNTQVMLTENTDAGQHLATFTARDPDVNSANTVVYIKGHDPADWITVDPVTGAITTSTSVDRESAFVKDGVYNVTIYAVDDGQPPMTGTATLSIHITDENDNTPTLSRNVIDMCQSDKATLANITVFDLDEEPFAGPFYFKLHGDVKGKWSVDRLQGYSVNLVRESSVPSGHFELLLEVSDHQHKGNIYNLSVTVCNCSNTQTPNCRFRKAATAALGVAALGIIFFSLLLFTGIILLAFLVTMKKPKLEIKDESIGQHLMQSNIEIPGTDCKLDFESLIKGSSQNVKSVKASQVSVQNTVPLTAAAVQQFHSQEAISRMRQQQRDYFLQGLTTESSKYRSDFKEQDWTRMNSKRWSVGASSNIRTRFESGNSQHQGWMTAGKYWSDTVISTHWEFLLTHLNRKLCNLQASEADTSEDVLHVYTEDQDNQTLVELEAISIPDISFDPDVDLNLTSAFCTLASICMPFESTLYKSSRVTETLETASLIQNEIKSKAGA
ncbi:uncharacterized protein V6R79_022190 [Siganus canaliculatus]